jgi:hypothetical protein
LAYRTDKLTKVRNELIEELANLQGSGHAFILLDTPETCARVAYAIDKHSDVFRNYSQVSPVHNTKVSSLSVPSEQVGITTTHLEQPNSAFPVKFNGTGLAMYK